MSSSTVRGAGGSPADANPSGTAAPGNSGSLLGLLDLLWRSIGGAPRQQLLVFAGGGALCICLVVSMACLIGSIGCGKRQRAKQQRKKVVVLTPDTCKYGCILAWCERHTRSVGVMYDALDPFWATSRQERGLRFSPELNFPRDKIVAGRRSRGKRIFIWKSCQIRS